MGKVPDHSSPFNNLPLDIWFEICDDLRPRDVACLSLTNKALYNSLRSIWTRGFNPREKHCGCVESQHYDKDNPSDCPLLEITNHEQVLFLQTLERELPDHTLCGVCQKFHPKRSTNTAIERATSCSRNSTALFDVWWPSDTWRPTYFEDAKEVMNRYRYGDRHGAPLESLMVTTDWHRPGRTSDWPSSKIPNVAGWRVKLDATPHIIDGNLLMQTHQRLFVPYINSGLSSAQHEAEAAPYHYDGQTMLRACGHLDHLFNESIMKGLQHERFSTHVELNVELSCEWQRRCTNCLTNLCFRMIRHNRRDIEFVLITCTNLGSCMNSGSPAWLAAACYDDGRWHKSTIEYATKRAQSELSYPDDIKPELLISHTRAYDPQAMEEQKRIESPEDWS